MPMEMVRCGRLCVAVVDDVPPSDAEWCQWTHLLGEEAGSQLRVMVETRSGPNAAQRKALAKVTRDRDVRFAILTDSIVVRGIITALTWLGVPHRAFLPGERARAATFLGLSDAEREQAQQQLTRLRNEVAACESCGVR